MRRIRMEIVFDLVVDGAVAAQRQVGFMVPRSVSPDEFMAEAKASLRAGVDENLRRGGASFTVSASDALKRGYEVRVNMEESAKYQLLCAEVRTLLRRR